MLVEDMPFELLECEMLLVADLTRVSTAELDDHPVGVISPAISHMLLGISFGPEVFFTSWTLFVSNCIAHRVILSLLS